MVRPSNGLPYVALAVLYPKIGMSPNFNQLVDGSAAEFVSAYGTTPRPKLPTLPRVETNVLLFVQSADTEPLHGEVESGQVSMTIE